MVTVEEAGRRARRLAFDRLAPDSARRPPERSPRWTAARPGERHSHARPSAPDQGNSSVFSRPSAVPSRRRGPRRRQRARRPRQARHPRSVTRSVLWDSSAILALLDADDADHARAVAVARDIASERRPSFITNYVEAETHALLLRKLGRGDRSRVAADGRVDGRAGSPRRGAKSQGDPGSAHRQGLDVVRRDLVRRARRSSRDEGLHLRSPLPTVRAHSGARFEPVTIHASRSDPQVVEQPQPARDLVPTGEG